MIGKTIFATSGTGIAEYNTGFINIVRKLTNIIEKTMRPENIVLTQGLARVRSWVPYAALFETK